MRYLRRFYSVPAAARAARSRASMLMPRFAEKHVPPETKTAGRSRPFCAAALRSPAVGHAAHGMRVRAIVEHEALAVGHLHLRQALRVHHRVGGNEAVEREQI